MGPVLVLVIGVLLLLAVKAKVTSEGTPGGPGGSGDPGGSGSGGSGASDSGGPGGGGNSLEDKIAKGAAGAAGAATAAGAVMAKLSSLGVTGTMAGTVGGGLLVQATNLAFVYKMGRPLPEVFAAGILPPQVSGVASTGAEVAEEVAKAMGAGEGSSTSIVSQVATYGGLTLAGLYGPLSTFFSLSTGGVAIIVAWILDETSALSHGRAGAARDYADRYWGKRIEIYNGLFNVNASASIEKQLSEAGLLRVATHVTRGFCERQNNIAREVHMRTAQGITVGDHEAWGLDRARFVSQLGILRPDEEPGWVDAYVPPDEIETVTEAVLVFDHLVPPVTHIENVSSRRDSKAGLIREIGSEWANASSWCERMTQPWGLGIFNQVNHARWWQGAGYFTGDLDNTHGKLHLLTTDYYGASHRWAWDLDPAHPKPQLVDESNNPI